MGGGDHGLHLAGPFQSLGSWLDSTAFPALPCTPHAAPPHRSWATQATGLGAPGLCGSRGQWEARPWFQKDLGWPGQGPTVATVHTKTSASRAAPQHLRPAQRPTPASWGNCSLNGMVGRASRAETTDVPIYFLSLRQAHPGWAQPQVSRSPGKTNLCDSRQRSSSPAIPVSGRDGFEGGCSVWQI